MTPLHQCNACRIMYMVSRKDIRAPIPISLFLFSFIRTTHCIQLRATFTHNQLLSTRSPSNLSLYISSLFPPRYIMSLSITSSLALRSSMVTLVSTPAPSKRPSASRKRERTDDDDESSPVSDPNRRLKLDSNEEDSRKKRLFLPTPPIASVEEYNADYFSNSESKTSDWSSDDNSHEAAPPNSDQSAPGNNANESEVSDEEKSKDGEEGLGSEYESQPSNQDRCSYCPGRKHIYITKLVNGKWVKFAY
ncbi:hypothetical protein CC78DRAFT_33073 [Lojkania enalia]|uniref:Uncharacterized protein n=1 Tax=Lojkania enalia TaxID=147567 RepID=A0A9P4KHQ6_9PLEO|nr:hypothetical protein CC78DRAFT_33073 [Didymosphaeria enalia]